MLNNGITKTALSQILKRESVIMTIYTGESLQTIVAMQSECTSLAHVKACAKVFSESHDNEYQAIVIFNDDTMLRIFDEGDGEGLQYDNEFNQDFVDFVLSVLKAYKSLDLCYSFETLKECFEIVDCFDSDKKALFDYLLSDYSYSYNIETLTNYCENNAYLFSGSASDYAFELIQNCYDTKSMGQLANYIDYDSFGRDMLLNSEIVELGHNLLWTNPNDIY